MKNMRVVSENRYTNEGFPYIFMEKQNWFAKGFNFLKRKFIGKSE